MRDLSEMCRRVEGLAEGNYAIIGASLQGDLWTLQIKRVANEKLPSDIYSLMQMLNGYDKNDYFSIVKAEDKGNLYEVVCKRVQEEEETE